MGLTDPRLATQAPSNRACTESQDMNIAPCFSQRRMGPPRASFESSADQPYHSGFTSNADQLDRSAGRGFAGYADNISSAEPVVLDGSSGRFLFEPSRPSLESHPMSRFYGELQAPWTAQAIEGPNQWDQSGLRFTTPNRQTILRTPASWNGFRDTTRSNPESHITSRQHPDSGYGTALPRTKSVVSGGEYLDHQDDNQSFINGVNGMQIQPGSPPETFYQDGSQPARSVNLENWHGVEDDNSTLTCSDPKCKERVIKNKSELKFVCGDRRMDLQI